MPHKSKAYCYTRLPQPAPPCISRVCALLSRAGPFARGPRLGSCPCAPSACRMTVFSERNWLAKTWRKECARTAHGHSSRSIALTRPKRTLPSTNASIGGSWTFRASRKFSKVGIRGLPCYLTHSVHKPTVTGLGPVNLRRGHASSRASTT